MLLQVTQRSMKFLLFLTVAVQIAFYADCLPLPAGQIVKYRVPSKFFSQTNATVQDGSDSLYNFLTQIHYGGTSQTVTINPNLIQSEDISQDVVSALPETTTSVAETPEVNYLFDIKCHPSNVCLRLFLS